MVFSFLLIFFSIIYIFFFIITLFIIQITYAITQFVSTTQFRNQNATRYVTAVKNIELKYLRYSLEPKSRVMFSFSRRPKLPTYSMASNNQWYVLKLMLLNSEC